MITFEGTDTGFADEAVLVIGVGIALADLPQQTGIAQPSDPGKTDPQISRCIAEAKIAIQPAISPGVIRMPVSAGPGAG